METTSLKRIKEKSDAWKELSSIPAFEEKFNEYLKEAAKYVNTEEFCLDHPDESEEDILYYEHDYQGSKKVVISYVTKPLSKEMGTKYKFFKEVSFIKNEFGNLEILESSGSLESVYNFDLTKGGVLQTRYALREYSRSGVELVYRSFEDEVPVTEYQFGRHYRSLRSCVRGGYRPLLKEFNGKKISCNILGNNPRLIEQSRSIDNLGLVKELHCYFKEDGSIDHDKEEYHFNRYSKIKGVEDPYAIHISRDILPIAYRDGNNKIAVNYKPDGITIYNYSGVAREMFITETNKKINEIIKKYNRLPQKDKTKRAQLEALLNKYQTVYDLACPSDTITLALHPNKKI